MASTFDESKLDEVLITLEQPDIQERMTPWERGFVASVSEQYEEKGYLTEGQLIKLEEIWMRMP